MKRYHTKRIYVGNVPIGDSAPVSIQSMTNTPTSDVDATLKQICSLAKCGCEIVRCSIPDMKSAEAVSEIIKESPIPVIGDIHFDWRLAIAAIRNGIHGIRLNPGNIGSADRVKAVAEAAGEADIPIRVGANAGSLPVGLYEKYLQAGLNHNNAIAESLCEAAQSQVSLLEQFGFKRIKVSLKASSVPIMVAAYRKFAAKSNYPLHLGVTEAGTPWRGIHKSAAGIGALLLDGIGDTIRVSLTAKPEEEVRSALALLESCELRDSAPQIVACPTCARTQYDLIETVSFIEKKIEEMKNAGKKIHLKKIAIMGCVVNGPGEAKDSDLGMAGGGDGKVVLFRYGKHFQTVSSDDAANIFLSIIESEYTDSMK